jgi:hypothetical protein
MCTVQYICKDSYTKTVFLPLLVPPVAYRPSSAGYSGTELDHLGGNIVYKPHYIHIYSYILQATVISHNSGHRTHLTANILHSIYIYMLYVCTVCDFHHGSNSTYTWALMYVHSFLRWYVAHPSRM